MLGWLIYNAVFYGVLALLAYAAWVSRGYYMPGPSNLSEFVEIHDEEFRKRWAGKRVPMETLLEAYIDSKVDIKGEDLFSALKNRDMYVNYALTPSHYHFLLTRFVPEFLIHSQSMDKKMVQEHYDRGDDFFSWFLGPRMVYTSAFFKTVNGEEGLEAGQDQKMNLVAEKLQLKKGESHLDIGCGWGTFAMHAAKNFGTKSLGVTISENQTKWGNKQIRENGVEDLAEVKCLDYRDIPNRKFDKISCLEMAEHVGVRKFYTFMCQCRDLLEDDGIFLLQVCGLRRAAKWRDLVWGLFMNKYIFPGADASTPLAFYVDKMEAANFEIHSVENLSWHYSVTIFLWYENWKKNKDLIVKTYGKRWYRIWLLFLSWSVLIAREGTAAVYQIVGTKNLDQADRARFVGPNYVALSHAQQ